jgi:hypothetical protein
MYNVYQHWDPLKVCVVGRSYPPEFYSWIKVPHVRKLFEKIATETEEDYQAIIQKLESFGVTIMRPNLPDQLETIDGKFTPPPMTPRDYMIMIGNKFYQSYSSTSIETLYNSVRDPSWPNCTTWAEFDRLPDRVRKECIDQFGFARERTWMNQTSGYSHIFEHVLEQGNDIIDNFNNPLRINGAMVSRIGQDLYFATTDYSDNIDQHQQFVNERFTETRNHIVNTGGHGDAVYCPVCPGLIISLKDVPTYAETFPGWEVVYLPEQSWDKVKPFLELKNKNQGKWWIPGFEQDQDVVDVVETWLGHWTGYVEETVFDVNMLIIDPKNVLVFNYNKQVFDALDRYGVTPHIVPFRHRYFWDGGIHCVTMDLHREGVMQDFFPRRA